MATEQPAHVSEPMLALARALDDAREHRGRIDEGALMRESHAASVEDALLRAADAMAEAQGLEHAEPLGTYECACELHPHLNEPLCSMLTAGQVRALTSPERLAFAARSGYAGCQGDPLERLLALSSYFNVAPEVACRGWALELRRAAGDIEVRKPGGHEAVAVLVGCEEEQLSHERLAELEADSVMLSSRWFDLSVESAGDVAVAIMVSRYAHASDVAIDDMPSRVARAAAKLMDGCASMEARATKLERRPVSIDVEGWDVAVTALRCFR